MSTKTYSETSTMARMVAYYPREKHCSFSKIRSMYFGFLPDYSKTGAYLIDRLSIRYFRFVRWSEVTAMSAKTSARTRQDDDLDWGGGRRRSCRAYVRPRCGDHVLSAAAADGLHRAADGQPLRTPPFVRYSARRRRRR